MEFVSPVLRLPRFGRQVQASGIGDGEIKVQGGPRAVGHPQLQRVAAFEEPGWYLVGKQPSQQPLKSHAAAQPLQIEALPQ